VEGVAVGLNRGAIATFSGDTEFKSQSRQEVLERIVFTLDHSNMTQEYVPAQYSTRCH